MRNVVAWRVIKKVLADRSNIVDKGSEITKKFLSLSIENTHRDKENASNLLNNLHIDGVLVGGASLNPQEFAKIAQSC